ncbi:MAG TPA: DUF4340 domain-containing protein [Candidatus Sulfotelmatobacter sp.]|nr:DUF4340 domain-containing protein [Candidatus Sulfotelmatobacter sp.]
MIRKPTLVVLVIAILLGGGLYYYQKKHSTPPPATDTSKPVFSGVQAADIQAMTVQHPDDTSAKPIDISRSGDGWEITQPLDTSADMSSVQGIADGLAEASSSQTEPDSPDRLKAYGLDPGAIAIDFTLKNGAKHKVVLGNKDFTGDGVYSLVDSNQKVYVLPTSLLTSADKSADDLRDKTVLHVDTDQASTVELKSPSGEIDLKKTTSGWSMTKPDAAAADSDAVSTLLSAVSTGKMASIASEKPDDLAKYGLTSPAITFTVTNDIGKASTLIVGKKQGDDYYARDTSRPTIFEIDADLYKKLTQTPAELLDKTPLHVDESNINEIQITDSNGSMVADRKSEENWVMQSPASVKGKAASDWKVFSVLSGLRADEVIEKPDAAVLASLAQPAYQLTLVDASGKKRTLRVSKPTGDYIYAQSSDSPAVFKIKKASLSDLDITPADLSS